MEPSSPKKIQFEVPPSHNQLDPQAAEQIRRRRPTPATPVLYSDPSAVESGNKWMTGNLGEAQLPRAQRKQGVYNPPVVKELQFVVEKHPQKQEQLETVCCENLDPLSAIADQHNGIGATQWVNWNCPEPNVSEAYGKLLLTDEDHPDSNCAGAARDALNTCQEEQVGAPPRRKDTPYQHLLSFTPGGKLVKVHKESAFPEEEEPHEEQGK